MTDQLLKAVSDDPEPPEVGDDDAGCILAYHSIDTSAFSDVEKNTLSNIVRGLTGKVRGAPEPDDDDDDDRPRKAKSKNGKTSAKQEANTDQGAPEGNPE